MSTCQVILLVLKDLKPAAPPVSPMDLDTDIPDITKLAPFESTGAYALDKNKAKKHKKKLSCIMLKFFWSTMHGICDVSQQFGCKTTVCLL